MKYSLERHPKELGRDLLCAREIRSACLFQDRSAEVSAMRLWSWQLGGQQAVSWLWQGWGRTEAGGKGAEWMELFSENRKEDSV